MSTALDSSDSEVVQGILRGMLEGVPVRIFGSRARGTNRRFSDLDLLLMTEEPLPPVRLGLLADAFDESDLPFRVDLVDAASADPGFLARIEGECVPFIEAVGRA